jgi:hypothetical protein
LLPKKWPFNQAMVAHAPEDPGVFLLWDGDECIYVGHARHETIRAALLRHMEGVSGACTKAATHYSWEITIWPAARETQLLAEFSAKHRRDPRCQQKTG